MIMSHINAAWSWYIVWYDTCTLSIKWECDVNIALPGRAKLL